MTEFKIGYKVASGQEGKDHAIDASDIVNGTGTTMCGRQVEVVLNNTFAPERGNNCATCVAKVRKETR